MMEKVLTVVLLGIPILVISVLIGTGFGEFSGWLVGLVYGDTILGVLGRLGLHGITMGQLGATLGFIGGCVRSTSVKSSAS